MNILPKETELKDCAEEFLFQHCLREVINLDGQYYGEWDLPYEYKDKESSEEYYGRDRDKVYYHFFVYNMLEDESSSGDYFDEVDWNPLEAFVKIYIETKEREVA